MFGGGKIKIDKDLLEKVKMLMDGALTKPIDIFDLFWHLLPDILLVMKLMRDRNVSGEQS